MVLNSLEPDQARTRSGFVGADLDPNFFVKKYQQTTLADKMLIGKAAVHTEIGFIKQYPTNGA